MLDRLIEIDRELFLWLKFHGGEFWDSFFSIVSTNLIWIPLYLLVLWLFYRKLGARGALVAAAVFAFTVASAQLTATLMKVLIVKPRPLYEPALEGLIRVVKEVDGYSSTVSAHAAVAFSTALFSTLLLRNRAYGVVIFLWALLVAYSRIYLNAHYPSDLLFGATTGLLIGWLGWRFYLHVLNRVRERYPWWLEG